MDRILNTNHRESMQEFITLFMFTSFSHLACMHACRVLCIAIVHVEYTPGTTRCGVPPFVIIIISFECMWNGCQVSTSTQTLCLTCSRYMRVLRHMNAGLSQQKQKRRTAKSRTPACCYLAELPGKQHSFWSSSLDARLITSNNKKNTDQQTRTQRKGRKKKNLIQFIYRPAVESRAKYCLFILLLIRAASQASAHTWLIISAFV